MIGDWIKVCMVLRCVIFRSQIGCYSPARWLRIEYVSWSSLAKARHCKLIRYRKSLLFSRTVWACTCLSLEHGTENTVPIIVALMSPWISDVKSKNSRVYFWVSKHCFRANRCFGHCVVITHCYCGTQGSTKFYVLTQCGLCGCKWFVDKFPRKLAISTRFSFRGACPCDLLLLPSFRYNSVPNVENVP